MSVTPVASTTNVQSAIANASQKTGVDFNYLLGQAQVESGMRANARARTSSATGLYQFIEQSWLGVVKMHGAEHGMAWAADSIRQTSGGRYMVSDPATRQAILQLRSNPQAASLMAAEHASDNKAALEATLDRPANGTDLYMAHFLGLGGAKSFLSAMQTNPGRNAAAMFPSAARANRGIFYGPNGYPRSLGEIYQRFGSKLDRGAQMAGGSGSATQALASTAAPDTSYSIGALDVVLGNGAVERDDHWVQTTLANLNVLTPQTPAQPQGQAFARSMIDPLRPTPDTARLAYLMLANLGA
ncbi:lytic transglycosylase domain-containing protein [Sphingomonas japonica]|uniref:Transglycosylase SLT domain-containing protein n=1 Tax=Sphingomonas japonica TaxID=511662 RepID=A0ABX0U092_9SPHN|nr:lytic transglycosylase domain-containing protein [Sphingomonas japonica]NIJ23986.1 hypothetical protein [Sphingomonas japonica]